MKNIDRNLLIGGLACTIPVLLLAALALLNVLDSAHGQTGESGSIGGHTLDRLSSAGWPEGVTNGESGLHSDLQTMWSQIELYRIQHKGKHPTVFDGGPECRMVNKTDENGNVDKMGAFGAYLRAVPANYRLTGRAATRITQGNGPPPFDGSSGWYYNVDTGQFWPNNRECKDAMLGRNGR